MAERSDTKQYMEKHHIAQFFEVLLAGLMIDRPEDPLEYLLEKLHMLRSNEVTNVNFEYFIHDKHPYRDPVRLDLVCDDSKYHCEYKKKLEKERMDTGLPESPEINAPISKRDEDILKCRPPPDSDRKRDQIFLTEKCTDGPGTQQVANEALCPQCQSQFTG